MSADQKPEAWVCPWGICTHDQAQACRRNMNHPRSGCGTLFPGGTTTEQAKAMIRETPKPAPTLYAERDHVAQGDFYLRHIDAMTREGLHAKSAIAAELAHRDAEIARLTAELSDCGKDNCMGQRVEGVTQWCTLEARDAAIAEAVAKERERCAKLCEDISDEYQRSEGRKYPELKSDAETGADACAAAIRTAQERT